ncbi:MAG: hypothetical protein AB2L07_09410 [Thermoanaerobaculaceae bacterium]
MTERPLDEWRDRMVLALCGELPDDERRALEQAIASDPELARDWQELGEARAMLRDLAEDTRRDEPVFTLPPRAAELIVPRWQPWRAGLAAAAGFFFAAMLGGGLLIAGLRVDRTDEGLLIRIGRVASQDDALQATAPAAIPAASPDTVTRAQLVAVTQALAGVVAARLDDLEKRQNDVQTETARVLFQALASRQQRQLDDLWTRIQVASYRGARPAKGPAADITQPHIERREP